MVDNLVVIRFGELMYAGSLEGLMEKATERVVAAPEQASDMPRLIEAVEAAGWNCEVARDQLIVDMPAERSAELARAATAAGLTLRMLNPEADTLETVFLRLTGATDAELSEQRRAQRHADES
jgi:ABC-type multidrug transport system ATPase subunit